MDSAALFKTLTLLRLLAFMVLLYLALGALVERYSTNPESKVRGFFRLLCLPVTKPVSRLLPPGASAQRVLRVSMFVVAALWLVLIVATEALRAA
jgi:uncharacterized protein YggT (Ycf19 family)